MNEFGEILCATLEEIEPGFVATYGDVAHRLGISARQAGREVGRVPDDVPWWRVVRADGTPPTCRGGMADALLRAEGVPMRGDRVDLDRGRFSWPACPGATVAVDH